MTQTGNTCKQDFTIWFSYQGVAWEYQQWILSLLQVAIFFQVYSGSIDNILYDAIIILITWDQPAYFLLHTTGKVTKMNTTIT